LKNKSNSNEKGLPYVWHRLRPTCKVDGLWRQLSFVLPAMQANKITDGILTNNFKKYIRQITPISDKEFDETVIYFQEQTLYKGDYFVKQGQVCQHRKFHTTW
jgi:hypothetical protein